MKEQENIFNISIFVPIIDLYFLTNYVVENSVTKSIYTNVTITENNETLVLPMNI